MIVHGPAAKCVDLLYDLLPPTFVIKTSEQMDRTFFIWNVYFAIRHF